LTTAAAAGSYSSLVFKSRFYFEAKMWLLEIKEKRIEMHRSFLCVSVCFFIFHAGIGSVDIGLTRGRETKGDCYVRVHNF